MKTLVIGLVAGLVVIVGGFFVVLGLVDASAPTPEEVRVEVSDALRD